jgi:two-component system chemotaxis sensor kinase CheA
MPGLDSDFLEELRAAFREEAAEHIQSIVSGLLEIEQNLPAAPAPDTAETIYRAAHSLKGASRAADMPVVGDVCQVLESVFSAMHAGDMLPSSAGFDTLLGAVQTIDRMITAPAEVSAAQADHLGKTLAALAAGGAAPPPEVPEEAVPETPAPAVLPADLRDATVRIGTDRLESLLLHAEQMLTAKLAAGERAMELRRIVNRFEQWMRGWALIEERILQLPAGLRQRHRRQIHALDVALHGLADDLQADHRHVGNLVNDLMEETKQVLLMPIGSILKPYPHMVRDIARSEGKMVSLVIEGESIALDKRILEQLVDPLTHLLRNCVDHGIEFPRERRETGKPERAVIRITVSQPGADRVEVCVADDGCGIDFDAVIRQSVQQGVLTEEAAAGLDHAQAMKLLFHSGLSTRGEVTRLSGRGLGLAIVRDNVENLGGTVAVDTTPGKGTVFTLRLPVTVSTFRAVIVRCAGSLFALPTTVVERAERLPLQEVVAAGNRIPWRGETLAVWPLERVLDLDDAASPPRRRPDPLEVLIVAVRGAPRAFAIDAVVGEQEILLKEVGPRLAGNPMLVGVTVLGSGEVVPVLDAGELVAGAVGEPPLDQADLASAVRRRRVLVAEDSITSRMLLKHLLEGAGYDVETVVDGAAALERVRREHFDIVVSDIEMPRMDGLEFTRRVRADAELAHLPVVLVTTRDRPEDEAAGMEAGAHAYIVKGRFDRDHLLAALDRLAREART